VIFCPPLRDGPGNEKPTCLGGHTSGSDGWLGQQPHSDLSACKGIMTHKCALVKCFLIVGLHSMRSYIAPLSLLRRNHPQRVCVCVSLPRVIVSTSSNKAQHLVVSSSERRLERVDTQYIVLCRATDRPLRDPTLSPRSPLLLQRRMVTRCIDAVGTW
jgi:hypothetical protein